MLLKKDRKGVIMQTRESKCGICPWKTPTEINSSNLEKLTSQELFDLMTYIKSESSDVQPCFAELRQTSKAYTVRGCKQ